MLLHAGWHFPWHSLGNACRRWHMESATKGRLPGKGILYPLALPVSAGISTYTLHSSTGGTEPQSQGWMLVGTTGTFATFCHLLCCPLHIPLFAHTGDVAASSCTKVVWPTLPPSHPDCSQSQWTRPWERNYTTFTKSDIFPTKPGGSTGIVFYFAAGLLKPSAALKISQGISCLGWFWKEEATIPTRQLNTLSENALECPNLSSEVSSENVLYIWEVWRACAYSHSDWQSHKRNVSEGKDLCWGKEWQAYFHA